MFIIYNKAKKNLKQYTENVVTISMTIFIHFDIIFKITKSIIKAPSVALVQE